MSWSGLEPRLSLLCQQTSVPKEDQHLTRSVWSMLGLTRMLCTSWNHNNEFCHKITVKMNPTSVSTPDPVIRPNTVTGTPFTWFISHTDSLVHTDFTYPYFICMDKWVDPNIGKGDGTSHTTWVTFDPPYFWPPLHNSPTERTHYQYHGTPVQ